MKLVLGESEGAERDQLVASATSEGHQWLLSSRSGESMQGFWRTSATVTQLTASEEPDSA